MPKRSSRPSDVNQLAAAVVGESTKGSERPKKNPAAVELGRLGGLKGGRARAKKLSKERRSEIARMAASVRWGNRQ